MDASLFLRAEAERHVFSAKFVPWRSVFIRLGNEPNSCDRRIGNDLELHKELWPVDIGKHDIDPEEGPQRVATAHSQNHGRSDGSVLFLHDLLWCIQYRKPPWGIPGRDLDAHLSLVSF